MELSSPILLDPCVHCLITDFLVWKVKGGREGRKVGRERGKEEGNKSRSGDFPGGPVVKTPRFYCRGRGFDPWWGN